MTYDLRTMIEMLRSEWPEPIEWALRIQDCTEECTAHKTGLTLTGLRHFECDCPSRIEYRNTSVTQAPIITQLFEAKWTVPVTGNSGGGNPNKSESKMPGNLVGPAVLLEKLNNAAYVICTDWELTPGWELEMKLDEIDTRAWSLRQECRDEEVEDAAAVLAVPFHEALVYLGYRSGRAYLADMVCDACGGALSAPRDLQGASVAVECEGSPQTPPCGRSWAPAEWLALLHHGAGQEGRTRNGEKQECPAGHRYDADNTRVGRDGRRHCKTCDRSRKAKKAEGGLYPLSARQGG